MNPRSGRADHPLNVSKFVTFSWWLPRHALAAVKILASVADASPAAAHPALLAALNPTDAVGQTIIKVH